MKLVAITFTLVSMITFINSFWWKKKDYPELPVVKLELPKMMGRWYNIAHKPIIFEKFCKCSRSDDSLVEPLKIKLSESCLIWGRNITSNSWAIPESEDSGKWTNVMDIFGPFKVRGDYWIIDRDDNYEWICVGHPDRKYFWIMSRKKEMDDSLYNELIRRALDKGFDVSDIIREDNTGCPE